MQSAIRRALLLAIFIVITPARADEAAAAPVALPKRLSGDAPEFPPTARRWNIEGTVMVKVRIDTRGRVEHSEVIQSPADVLSEAALRVLPSWRFTKPAAPVEGTVNFPFWLTGGGYAFDTKIRTMTYAPQRRADISRDVAEGWSSVRLMIDQSGTVTERYLLKSSSVEFVTATNAIVDTLRFAPAAPGAAYEGISPVAVNAFTIRVMGSQARVEQAEGKL